ncbi:MAG: hypothetical protein KKE91_04900, partial [Candidatus Omnitrophica bacterium]|nr:hypothetical protein [Candidatus Omnitrophota bacterium]
MNLAIFSFNETLISGFCLARAGFFRRALRFTLRFRRRLPTRTTFAHRKALRTFAEKILMRAPART